MVKRNLLYKELKEKLNLNSLKKAEEIYLSYCDMLFDALIEYGSVKLPGIGIINVKTKKGKTYRVPVKEELCPVPDKRSVALKPSKFLKRKLNEEKKNG